MRKFGLILGFVFCINCGAPSSSEEAKWQLIYKNSADGTPLFGNKQDLLNAIRNGNPVKIGFGGQLRKDTTLTIEHVFEAHFFTILNDTDVYAQMLPIIGQTPLIEKDTTNIVFRETHWNILVGTNGFSDRLTMSLAKDTILGHNQRNMNVSWFVKQGPSSEEKGIPLWKN
ncbi:hypothetical protein [Flagellimonas sp.]|uniref:hypothetical protein n=1 Tax=Flagellimonas sp. TaxID=2058762 RepID=UPI003F4A4396